MEPQTSELRPATEYDELLAFHRAHSRSRLVDSIAVCLVLFAAAVTTAILWPSRCQQLATELCRGAWLPTCEAVERAVEERVAEVDEPEAFCGEQLEISAELAELTYTLSGEPPSLYFLGLLREVIGEQRFAQLNISARASYGRIVTIGLDPESNGQR